MSPNKTFFILCLIVFFSISNGVYAQALRSSDPDPNAPKTKTIHRDKSEEPTITSKPVVNPPRDEVGTFSLNGYLGGLNGANNYVSVPSATAFDQNVDGTIEMWIYPLTVSGTQEIMDKGITSNNEFMLGLAGTNLYFRIGTTPVINTGGVAIAANTWTHIAITWTGGGPFTVSFYVNGALSGATQNNTGTWPIDTDPIRIGAPCPAFSSEVYNGYIDEVRFWDPALTAAQIATNRFISLGDGAAANASSALTSSSAYTGLLASWTFNTGGTAYDDIGGYNGIFTGTAAAYGTEAGQPIPYNLALICPFGANDYVTVPSNAAFNLSTGGTAEAWVYPTGQTTTHMIMSRGTTGFDFFWGVRASIGNKQVVDIGAGTQFGNSDGVAIPLNKWTHVAIAWVQNGGSYTVTFYVNGQQSGTPQSSTTTWTSTAGTLRIGGWHGGTANNWNGYLDEVRLWNTTRNIDQIKSTMFGSCRGITSVAGMVGAWNFDSNLNNFASTTGINGSFSTGGANNCRLSAYSNEASTGPISTSFIAHATVVNRLATGNPFPGGFAINAPNTPIPDLGTVTSNIVMGGSGAVTSVEVFLSIQHTFISDLSVKLTAPNTTQKDLILQHGGGSSSGILTFVVDGGLVTSTAGWYAPWSNACGPDAAMGNFGGSNVNGTWTLTVQDNSAGDSGTLLGWGIRLNGSLTGVEQTSNNVPGKFALYQNYPNPFNPTTNIKFDIPKDGNVKIKVYDILGRQVASVLDEFKKAGQYAVNFDASNFASGAYFYKITSGDFVDTKKMMLIK